MREEIGLTNLHFSSFFSISFLLGFEINPDRHDVQIMNVADLSQAFQEQDKPTAASGASQTPWRRDPGNKKRAVVRSSARSLTASCGVGGGTTLEPDGSAAAKSDIDHYTDIKSPNDSKEQNHS